MTEPTEGEPLLVRQFLAPGREPAEAPEVRWPAREYRTIKSHRAAAAAPPAPAKAAAPRTEAPAARPRRRAMVLAAAGAVTAAGLATAGYALFSPDTPGARVPIPAGALPPVADPDAPGVSSDAGLPADPGEPATAPRPGTPGGATGTSRTTAPAAPGATGPTTITGSATIPRAITTTGTPPAPAPTTGASTAETGDPLALAPPPPAATTPAADRTGAITAADGRCLDLRDANPADGNDITVFDCNGTSAQRFTLATDGTLRVSGKCTRVTDGAAVRVIGCDDRDATRWRTATDGSVVTQSSGRCLTAPDSGREVKVSSCTGNDRQRWRLPG